MGELAKGKVVKEKYGAKLVFPEGGAQTKKTFCGRVMIGYFLKEHNIPRTEASTESFMLSKTICSPCPHQLPW